LRSGAHCDLEFAVEVRQCPLRYLRSGVCRWGKEEGRREGGGKEPEKEL